VDGFSRSLLDFLLKQIENIDLRFDLPISQLNQHFSIESSFPADPPSLIG
jgi:hypothetical protein